MANASLLSPSQRQWVIRQSGFDPSQYQLDDDGVISPIQIASSPSNADDFPHPKLEAPKATNDFGFGGTALKTAIHEAPSAVAGTGMAAYLTPAAQAIAQIPHPLAKLAYLIPPIAGAITAAGTHAGQVAIEKEVAPEYLKSLEETQQVNPWGARLGSAGAMLAGGFNPNPMNVGRATLSAGKLLTKPIHGARLTLEEAQNLSNVGLGTAIGTGIQAGHNIVAGQPIETGLGEAALSGALFNSPNWIAKRMGIGHEFNSLHPVRSDITEGTPVVQTEVAQPQTLPIGGIDVVPPTMSPEQILSQFPMFRREKAVKEYTPRMPVYTSDQELQLLNAQGQLPSRYEQPRRVYATVDTPNKSAAESALNMQQLWQEKSPVVERLKQTDFERAMREKEAQDSAALLEAAQATQIRLNQQKASEAQAQHQANVAELQSLLSRGNVGRPEIRTEPLAETPLGKPLYPDYTGATEAENAVKLSPTELEAERIQTDIEKRNPKYSEEAPVGQRPLTPAEQRMKNEAEAAGVKLTPTEEWNAKMRNVAAFRGQQLVTDKPLVGPSGKPVAGVSFARTSPTEPALAATNPQKADVTTAPHELQGHNFLADLATSKNKSDNQLHKDYLEFTANNPEFAAINEARVKSGREPWTPEEFIANEAGAEYVRDRLGLRNEGEFKGWWNDIKSHFKTKWKSASGDDYARVLNYKFVNDAPFNPAKYSGVGAAGVAKMSEESTKSPARQRYEELQNQIMDKVMTGDTDSQEFQSLWHESEAIKNNHGGMPPKYSEEAPTFVTQTQKELERDKPFGLQLSRNGTVETTQLKAKLAQLPKAEQELLRMAGIDQQLKLPATNAKELGEWVRNNGPKVEVHSYGMEGKVSEAKKEYDKMTHEWLDAMPQEARATMQRLYIKRQEHDNIGVQKAKDDLIANYGIKEQDINKYIKLGEQAVADSNANERNGAVKATSAYEHVSALPTNEPMPSWTNSKMRNNVQRIDVVIPHEWYKSTSEYAAEVEKYNAALAKLPEDAQRDLRSVGPQRRKEPLWQPDNLHENLPNTLGWAMIQYKTVLRNKRTGAILESDIHTPKTSVKNSAYEDALNNPEWEQQRVAVIAEAQSRWGQYVRNKTIEQDLEQYGGLTATQRAEAKNKINHPLLKDYNRLILKAAIDQARKEGATHIVVSDAETAMMTEGHDLQTATQTKLASDKATLDKLAQDKGYTITKGPYEKSNGLWEMQYTERPPQEPGMRLNYDTILPKIAEELTGSKGEKVSLGEHKNAYKPASTTYGYPENTVKRENLIFSNPDGTPKTDVSGMMFPLGRAAERRATGEPYSIAGAKYSEEAPTGKTEVKPRSSPLTHYFSGEVQKVAKQSKPVADAMTDFYERNRAHKGKLETGFLADVFKINPFDYFSKEGLLNWVKMDTPENRRVVQYLDAVSDGEPEPFKLNETEQRIADAVRASLKRSLAMREARKGADGVEGLAHYNEGNPNYFPHTMSREAAKTLFENPTGDKATSYYKDFIAYQKKNGGMTQEQADVAWGKVRKAGSKESHNLAQRFGPIDKSAGIGLPKSMREPNLIDRMSRFNRRYARRLAYYDAFETKPDVMETLFNQKNGIETNENVKNVLEDIYGVREHNETRRQALAGIVRAGMMGTLAGVKDFTTNFTLSLQHMDLDQVLPAATSAFEHAKENYRRAQEEGVVRYNVAGLEQGEGGIDSVIHGLHRARDVMNAVQGRQLLENGARTIAFGQGRFLAGEALHALANKKLTAQKRKFLDDFVPNWENYKTTKAPDEVINEAAAKFVESVQGGYDYRGLPAVAMRGSLAPYLSLARWNMEKLNNFTTHVIEPARQGNYKPLLMSTLGMALGGAAIEAIVEEAQNKKSKVPTTTEIEEAKDEEQLKLAGYKAAYYASMSGYMGILGDLIKTAYDVHYKNRVNTFGNPLLEGGSMMLENVGDLVEAMNKNDLPEVTTVIGQMLEDFSQTYRVANAHLNPEQIEQNAKSDKFRDLKVYNMAQGNDLPETSDTRPNPFIGAEAREFKHTKDLDKAAKLATSLTDKAVKKSGGDAEKLQDELGKLKRNSYQTMPSPDRLPVKFQKYYDWMVKTQGKEHADAVLKDYLEQNALNEAKSGMIP